MPAGTTGTFCAYRRWLRPPYAVPHGSPPWRPRDRGAWYADGHDAAARAPHRHSADRPGGRLRPGRAADRRSVGRGRRCRHPVRRRTGSPTLGSEPEAVAIGDVTGDGRGRRRRDHRLRQRPADDFKLMVLAGQADGTLAAPVALRHRRHVPRPARDRRPRRHRRRRADRRRGRAVRPRHPGVPWPGGRHARRAGVPRQRRTATRSRSAASTAAVAPRSPGSAGAPTP